MKSTLLALSPLLPLVVQERVDQTTYNKMRSEELEHSEIMHRLHVLTDRYGPRVTGNPNHEMAANRAASGKIVLIGKAAVIAVNFDPPVKRQPDDQVKAQFGPFNPAAGFGRGGAAPDTYQRIIPEDVEKAAAIVAAGVLHNSNRDEMVPRFAKDKMLAPVKIPEF